MEHDVILGVLTGRRSGIVVLDVDSEQGEEALAALEAEHGTLPATVTGVPNTGRGRHLYFRAGREAVGNSAGRVGTGLDVRGERGFVVAPPSTHAGGSRYAWIAHPSDVAVQPIPDWLVQRMVRDHSVRLHDVPERAASSHSSYRPPVGDPFIHEGSRNNTLTRQAGVMIAHGLALPAVEAALPVQNRERCRPELPEGDVETILQSASQWPAPPVWITDPVRFVDDPAVSGRARFVLLILAHHADADGYCGSSDRYLGRRTGFGKNAIGDLLRELERAGRIRIVRRAPKVRSVYQVLNWLPHDSSPYLLPTTGTPVPPSGQSALVLTKREIGRRRHELVPPDRVCVVCDASLGGRRKHAKHCSPTCRAEAARIRAILDGKGSCRYRSLAQRLEAAQRRTQRATQGAEDTTGAAT